MGVRALSATITTSKRNVVDRDGDRGLGCVRMLGIITGVYDAVEGALHDHDRAGAASGALYCVAAARAERELS